MRRYIKSSWIQTNAESLDPKLTQQVFKSQNIMVVRYVYEPGLEFPEHSHPQEQVTIVSSGELLFDIDGEKVKVKKDEICAISPNVPHSTKVISEEGAQTVSIFTPIKDRVIIERE
ncbi:MAG: cupin domain-containing protein [Calditrichaceae bacterium]